MLDKNQIAAASKILHDHWRAGTKLRRPRSLLCGRTIASRLTRSRPRSKDTHPSQSVRLEDRSHQRSRPEAYQCRWPDGRTHSGRDRDIPMAARLRWRATKCASASPNSPFACARICRRASAPYTLQQVLDAVDTLHPAIEIPDSRFADFVSAGAAQIIADNACAHLFVLGPPATRGLARARSRRGEARHHAARSAIHRSRQERARRSPHRADMACQRIAPAWRDAESRPTSSRPAPAIRRCRSSPAISAPSISVRSERCRWGSSSLSHVIASAGRIANRHPSRDSANRRSIASCVACARSHSTGTTIFTDARKSPSPRAHAWRRTGSRPQNRRSCPSTDFSARCARRSWRSARNAAPAHR